jgi:glutaredoxin 3
MAGIIAGAPGGGLDTAAKVWRRMVPHITIFTSEACGFCVRAKNLLAAKGVVYEEVNLPKYDLDSRRRLVELTGRYTFPQILFGETPIGGYDDLRALDESGRLDPLIGVA